MKGQSGQGSLNRKKGTCNAGRWHGQQAKRSRGQQKTRAAAWLAGMRMSLTVACETVIRTRTCVGKHICYGNGTSLLAVLVATVGEGLACDKMGHEMELAIAKQSQLKKTHLLCRAPTQTKEQSGSAQGHAGTTCMPC